MTEGALEAILLVGGRGTRLRPLTLSTPKPMLPAAGVPLLGHQLARLRIAGVSHVVLATSYHAEAFERYFGNGSGYGVELECVVEEKPLGTGGAIRNAAGRLRAAPGEPVLVLNGDILSGHDLVEQVALHRESGAAVTLHLTEVPEAGGFGRVPIAADGRVTAFHEKSSEPVTNRVNAGCYVFDREIIDRIPAGVNVSVEQETFPTLLREDALLRADVDSAYWLDVGTPAAYVRGSCDLTAGTLPSAALPGPPGAALVLDDASVAPDASVCGGTAVGAGALIGPGTQVSGSVLFDGAAVGEGAVIRDSVVARDAWIGPGATLDGAVVGDGAVIGPRNELVHGLRVWPGMELAPGAVRFSSDI